MDQDDVLAHRFEQDRTHLRAVAYRMLGSQAEADDAVQEAWLRLSRSDTAAVENLTGWLTTVVARVSLDMLRARSTRSAREDQAELPAAPDPVAEAELADSVGLALLVVLDTLAPAERLAFVLHDTFGMPFEEIAPIVGKSPAAARQLASRARRRVRGAAAPHDVSRQREVVAAFLAASRKGDFQALLAVLDPSVVLRADAAAVTAGAAAMVSGATAVAETFAGRARAARPALLDGAPGLVWLAGGQPRMAFRFTFAGDRVTGITIVAGGLDAVDVVLLD